MQNRREPGNGTDNPQKIAERKAVGVLFWAGGWLLDREGSRIIGQEFDTHSFRHVSSAGPDLLKAYCHGPMLEEGPVL